MRGVAQGLRGIRSRQAFAATIAIKASQARQMPGDCRAGVLAFVEKCDVGPQVVECHLIDPGHARRLFLQELPQAGQVFAVGFDRQRRSVSLDALEPQRNWSTADCNGRLGLPATRDVCFGCGSRSAARFGASPAAVGRLALGFRKPCIVRTFTVQLADLLAEHGRVVPGEAEFGIAGEAPQRAEQCPAALVVVEKI